MHRCSLLLGLALLALGPGCGDDDGPVDSGPPALDQCTNAGDLAIIVTLATAMDGGVPDGGFPDGGFPDGGPYPDTLLGALGGAFDACTRTVEGCYQEILLETDVEQCLEACLTTNMSPAVDISTGCTECNNEVVRCASAECLTECLAGTDLCEACAAEFCVPRYSDCTGLPAPTL